MMPQTLAAPRRSVGLWTWVATGRPLPVDGLMTAFQRPDDVLVRSSGGTLVGSLPCRTLNGWAAFLRGVQPLWSATVSNWRRNVAQDVDPSTFGCCNLPAFAYVFGSSATRSGVHCPQLGLEVSKSHRVASNKKRPVDSMSCRAASLFPWAICNPLLKSLQRLRVYC
jgi:hypothetical protein